jgi:SNF2 family DNA or RNA helicase
LKYDPWDTYAFWKHAIAENFINNSEQSVIILKKILYPLILRRTKSSTCQGEKIINLPEKYLYKIELDFSDDEKNIY